MESEDIESAMEDDCTDYGRSYLHIDPQDKYEGVYLGEKVKQGRYLS